MKNILLSSFIAISLASCNSSTPDTTAQLETTTPSTETSASAPSIVRDTLVDSDGEKLIMEFNILEGAATVDYQGENIELSSERPASGIWYTNDRYDLRGKGDDVELKRDGKTVFSHESASVSVQSYDYTNAYNETITVHYYPNDALATLIIGGDIIDLTKKKIAVGELYGNNDYRLHRNGNKIRISRGDKLVFMN